MKGKRNESAEGSQKTQIDRVRETAHGLSCDEDEAAFKARLAVIARHTEAQTRSAQEAGRRAATTALAQIPGVTDLAQLQEQITLEQVDAIIERSRQHLIGSPVKAKWASLFGLLRDGDTIWTYLLENANFRRDWECGIAVVRNGNVVGRVILDINP